MASEWLPIALMFSLAIQRPREKYNQENHIIETISVFGTPEEYRGA